jgi:hypothetical protein
MHKKSIEALVCDAESDLIEVAFITYIDSFVCVFQ